MPEAAVAAQRTRRAAKGRDNKHVRFIGPVLSVRAPNEKASTAEAAEVAESDSLVSDKENGQFSFSRRALQPRPPSDCGFRPALSGAEGIADCGLKDGKPGT
jgi:hypothetical protein